MRLKVGDKVKSDFWHDEKDIIRTITFFKKNSDYGSGYCASADDGGKCPCCGKPYGKTITGVDAAWFKKVELGINNTRLSK